MLFRSKTFDLEREVSDTWVFDGSNTLPVKHPLVSETSLQVGEEEEEGREMTELLSHRCNHDYHDLNTVCSPNML